MSLLFCISLPLTPSLYYRFYLLLLLLIIASTDHRFIASSRQHVHRFRFFKKSYVNLDTLSLTPLTEHPLTGHPLTGHHLTRRSWALSRRSLGALKALSSALSRRSQGTALNARQHHFPNPCRCMLTDYWLCVQYNLLNRDRNQYA